MLLEGEDAAEADSTRLRWFHEEKAEGDQGGPSGSVEPEPMAD
jgi:hypothetical protein